MELREMKEIDIENWERKEHYRFFSQSDLPFYNVSFNVDITGLPEYTKQHHLSFTNTVMYLTVRAMRQIRNFLYRIENGKVVEYNTLDPSFACLKDGEELFRFITVKYTDDPKEFDHNAKAAVRKSTKYFDIGPETERSNFVFISSLPWIPFTGISHTLSLNRDDAVPRVSWGKYFYSDKTLCMPYDVQVNHRFVDGLHVGKFYEKLHEEIRTMIRI